MIVSTNPINAIIAFLPDMDPASAYALVDLLNRPFTEIERRHVTDLGIVLKRPIGLDDGDEVFAVINRVGLKDSSAIKGSEIHSVLTRFSYRANIDHCEQLSQEIISLVQKQTIDPSRLKGLFTSMRNYHTRMGALDKVRNLLSKSGLRI